MDIAEDEEWFMPRANRRLRSVPSHERNEDRLHPTEQRNPPSEVSWSQLQQRETVQSQRDSIPIHQVAPPDSHQVAAQSHYDTAHSNASYIPDTPVKRNAPVDVNNVERFDSFHGTAHTQHNEWEFPHSKGNSKGNPREDSHRMSTNPFYNYQPNITRPESFSNYSRQSSDGSYTTSPISPEARNFFLGEHATQHSSSIPADHHYSSPMHSETNPFLSGHNFTHSSELSLDRYNSFPSSDGTLAKDQSGGHVNSSLDQEDSMASTDSNTGQSPSSIHRRHDQEESAVFENPVVQLESNDPPLDRLNSWPPEAAPQQPQKSSRSFFKSRSKKPKKSSQSTSTPLPAKGHMGFAIPASEMTQEEAGYLNRSNTSLNKSSTQSLNKSSNQSLNKSSNSLRLEDGHSSLQSHSPVMGDPSGGFQQRPSPPGTSLRAPPNPQHPECNISFNVQDASPGFLLRRLSLLFENNKYEECSVLLQRISPVTLKSILAELPVRDILDAIPYSLTIVHTLYTKIYTMDAENFPLVCLYPEMFVSRIVEWFAYTDSVNEEGHGHYLSLIGDVLGIVAHVQPGIFRKLYARRNTLDQCVEGLGNHGLVDTSDLKLMKLHDALKVEFQLMSHQLRAGVQKLEELSLSRTPVSRSLHRGKAPSGASHQRMMTLTQTDVQQRLIKNKSLLNVVEPAMSNSYLTGLLRTLEERIESDKAVIFLFTELNKDLATGLAASRMLAPVFQQFSGAYSRLLSLLTTLPPCGSDCDLCDERGLLCDWQQKDGNVTGSTTSFTGAAGPGAPSRAPIDRDKAPLPNPARVQPVKPRPANDSPPPTEPISIPVTSANGTAHNIAASLPVGGGALSGDREETEALKKEVTLLRKELTKCRETIRKLEERENSMKERLSEQAIRGLEKGSTKFEDLNLGDNRPTQLIRRYGNLYSETRLDAFDALEDLPEIADFDDLKGKLLFSVVVLAFRSVQRSLSDTRSKIRALLCLPPADTKTSFSREPIVRQLEDTISVYLRKFVSKYDCSTNVQNPLHDLTEEVCQQVWSTLYDYPSLKECSGLKQYIDECVKLAWALSVQNPPLTIDYEIKVFHEDVHTRFHTSDPESETIKSILWPSLREGEKGPCVFKGVVVT